VFLFCEKTAAQHSFTTQIYIDIVQHRNSLTREREERRAVRSLHRGDKCARGFFRISGPNHVDVRDQTNRADSFYGFMRRTIFADTDRIVRENVSVWQL